MPRDCIQPQTEGLPLVCTVVLEWNNFEDTNECLEALLKLTYANHRIILVDNGSDAQTLAALRQRWSHQVHIVESTRNLGCGAGYNLGMETALGMGADYVAIVDNDVLVEPDFIDALLEPFGDPTVAMTSPIVIRFDQPDRIWFAQAIHHQLPKVMTHRFKGESLSKAGSLLGRTYPTPYAPSCSVLMSRSALERVGLMDGRLFYGYDDVDWCMRASRFGLKTLVAGKPLARHKVSATGGVRGTDRFTPFSACHDGRGTFLYGANSTRSWGSLAFVIGQFMTRFPYHMLQMLKHRDMKSSFAFAKGARDGIKLAWFTKPSDNNNEVPTWIPTQGDRPLPESPSNSGRQWVADEGSRLVSFDDVFHAAVLFGLLPLSRLDSRF